MEERGSNNQQIQKVVLGIGFMVLGLRCLHYRAVNYFLKDELNVDPSTLQVIKNTVNLPMVAKPIFGIISDAFYIRGEHRIPYIAFGALLQALSWLPLAILSPGNITVISVYLILSNIGASIADVGNDAILTELGKQSTSSMSGPKSTSSGELQSFVWIAASVGGILGHVLGGISIDRFSPKLNFLSYGVFVLLQFLLTISVRERTLNLPKCSSHERIKKRLSVLWHASKQPEIVYSIIWFAASFAVIPDLTGTMFFYQTQHLNIEKSVAGFSKVFAQVIKLLWSIVYNRRLRSASPRKLICDIQVMLAIFLILDALSVEGFFRKLGISDPVYAVFFSGILDVLLLFKILPFSVLMAQLCPPGCEASIMAFAMSAVALAMIMSGYWGVVVASYFGITGNNYSKLSHALSIQAVCTLLPLLWTPWLHDGSRSRRRRNRE